MRRAALAAAALVLVVVAAGARPECAYACTCAPFDAERSLAEADAAVVAGVVERRIEGETAVLVLDVERRLKGPVGGRLEVATAVDSAGCGVEAAPGQRVGLFLRRQADVWRASVCEQARPEALASIPSAASGEDVADSFASATAWVIAILALAAIGIFLLRRWYRPD